MGYAKIPYMIYLFSRDFVIIIVIANAITLPLVWLALKRWLKEFAFQAGISWIIFVIPAVILLVISLSTVGFQTMKKGSVNLIDHLRQD